MVTLRQLRYFHALAGTGHFGRAAEASGVSQPALSMQLRELEATLGGALVTRGPDGAGLTELGRDVESRATHILAAVRDLEDLARVHEAQFAGPLRLGIIPSVAPFLLPRLLTRAAREYPALQLIVRETITGYLIEELADGGLDAIVASLPLEAGDFEEAAAFDDAFLLAAPAGSPYARQSPALAEAIAAEDLLLLEDGHCLRDQALAVCHRIDPRRLRSFGATSIATVLQLVAAGQGITLVPQMAVDAGISADPRLAVVRFAAPEPYRTVGLAWRKASPRRAHFLALVDLIRPAGAGKVAAPRRAQTRKQKS
jgi:LysR family hydrogen peroxide-inducible transcriptional activator